MDAKTSKPGRWRGQLDYKLFAVGATQAPKVSGNAKASNGTIENLGQKVTKYATNVSATDDGLPPGQPNRIDRH